MIEIVLSGAVTLLPWAFAMLGLVVLAGFGWRVGLPMVRILQLRAEVDLLRVQLETAQESLKAAQERENRCIAKLEEAMTRLEESDQRVRTLVSAIDIKHKLDTLADTLQPVTMKNPHYDTT